MTYFPCNQCGMLLDTEDDRIVHESLAHDSHEHEWVIIAKEPSGEDISTIWGCHCGEQKTVEYEL